MGRQGSGLTQVDREHVNGKENRLVMYKHHTVLYTMHMGGWKDNVQVPVASEAENVVPHYSADCIVNPFSATTCTTLNPRFKATLSDSESAILSPTSIDSAHGGKASLLPKAMRCNFEPEQQTWTRVASARSWPTSEVRTTTPWQLDLDHINDRDRIFSLDFSGCCVAE
jgi:hypothetical protein